MIHHKWWAAHARVFDDPAISPYRDYVNRRQARVIAVVCIAVCVLTFGGYGVVKVPRFQALLRHICERGFEHHTAMSLSQTASAINEAFGKYLGWDVYHHA